METNIDKLVKEVAKLEKDANKASGGAAAASGRPSEAPSNATT